MTSTVAVPLWLLILIVGFAAVTFASHFLFPSVRWFFRKRAERVISRLNTRLQKPIEPFKLARRYDMIQRLIYDPEVSQAIADYARQESVPENVAFERARRYAREIVPSFSATAYFTFGMRLAKWLSRSLYRLRLGEYDRQTYDAVDRDAAIIFVINHRSNMDYVLVTWLVSRSAALSYAVGEWARIWPLSSVIRMMGAYFIRRKSRGALYRKVLARYVQLATRGGVTQAIFPEGGLSLDGRLAEPKLGILNYIVSDFDPQAREVIFVPVAINYDRVIEDRILIKAGQSETRRFRPPLGYLLTQMRIHIWTRLTRQFKGFGTATVSFGTPLTLSDFLSEREGAGSAELAAEMMDRIRAVMPVLPVPLVARAILAGARGQEIARAVTADLDRLKETGTPVPRRALDEVVAAGRRILETRTLIDADGKPSASAGPVLEFYAASIAHHFDAPAATTTPISASAKQ